MTEARRPSLAARRARARRSSADGAAPSTTSRGSGWRSLTPDVERAARPRSTTRRTSAIASRVAASGAGVEGQPARNTESGASSHGSRTRTCHTWSARNGSTGETTRSDWTRAHQRTRSEVSSPSQKRRREQRMYQFERSSTNDSNARITSTVSQRSYASVASATSRCVRATSQRSSGRARRRPLRGRRSAAGRVRCSRTGRGT